MSNKLQVVNNRIGHQMRLIGFYLLESHLKGVYIIMVGKRIKQLRQEHKMTQQDFASLLNLNGSAISLYENGKRMPEYDIIIKIANHFNVTVDWLLGRIEERDLVKLEKDYIPKELLNVGVEYLKLAKEMENKSIPPEDIRKIISAINALKKD